jgi:hypothetical protein
MLELQDLGDRLKLREAVRVHHTPDKEKGTYVLVFEKSKGVVFV